VTTQAFTQALEAEIVEHPAVSHPFLKQFAAAELSRGQLITFGLQHYQLVRIFVTYMTNLLPKFPGGHGKELLGPVFWDEFGQWTLFRSHVHLYQKFLKALGCSDEDWGRVPRLPETDGYIQTHLAITRDQPFLVGLGTIGPAHEFPIPIMFASLVDGIRKNSPLTDDDIEYFTMHIVEDKEHANVFNRIIERYVNTSADEAQVRDGALRSLAARVRFWDGCQRAVFGE